MEHQEDYSNPSLKELTLKARLKNILVCRTSTLFEDSPCPEIFMMVFLPNRTWSSYPYADDFQNKNIFRLYDPNFWCVELYGKPEYF